LHLRDDQSGTGNSSRRLPQLASSRAYQLQVPQFQGNAVQFRTSAVSGATPSGSVQLTVDPATRSGTILNLMVGMEHRRAGLGTRLMQAAVAQAKLLGLSSLSLEARSPEHGFPGSHLVGFYRKLGFHENGPALRGGPRMSLALGATSFSQTPTIQPKRAGTPVFAPVPHLGGPRGLIQAKPAKLPVFAPVPRVGVNPGATLQPKQAGRPVFAPVPRIFAPHGTVLQRARAAPVPVATVNVSDLRFTQASVSPSFTSVPTGTAARLANLDSAAAEVKKSGSHPAWLQGLNVFKITHAEYGTNIYTLDNRRAYVLQKAALLSFTPTWATIQEVYNNLFKFTAADDSKSIKLKDTKAESVIPTEYSLIGQFVKAILAAVGVESIAALPAWSVAAAAVAPVAVTFQFNV